MSFLTLGGMAGLGSAQGSSWKSEALRVIAAAEFTDDDDNQELVRAAGDMEAAINAGDVAEARKVASFASFVVAQEVNPYKEAGRPVPSTLGRVTYIFNTGVFRAEDAEEEESGGYQGGTGIVSFSDPAESRVTSRAVNTMQAERGLSVQEQIRRARLQHAQATASRRRVANEPVSRRSAPSTPGLTEAQQLLMLMQANQEADRKESSNDMARTLLFGLGTAAALVVVVAGIGKLIGGRGS
jgi:hypothetical protein